MFRSTYIVLAATLCFSAVEAQAQALRVPAFTAYIQPEGDAARVSRRSGVTRWTNRNQSVNWYGKFERTGKLSAKIDLRLAGKAQSRLQLSADGQAHQATAVGQGDDVPVTADFGEFSMAGARYKRFKLESLNDPGDAIGEIDGLLLDGPAISEAHFNLKRRRNAASVHLIYPIPNDAKVEALYCEATAIEDPTSTFSHEPTGKSDRFDRFMGVENGQVFLSRLRLAVKR